MVRTLIIPGYRGSEKGHWQDHFLQQDKSAIKVEQEDWEHPILADWLHRLEAELMNSPRSILVGHSLGGLLIAYLHNRPAASHIAGAVIVAPADGARLARSDGKFASFSEMPTARLPFPTILVASHNDPYMSFATASFFADSWGAALVDIGHAGHVNVASGHGPWPEAHALVASLRQREPQSDEEFDRQPSALSARAFPIETESFRRRGSATKQKVRAYHMVERSPETL
ncbi:alpha/beta hydrolase [Aureimonas fodinaquatilis]|uniref:Alpha/beta hydrolase n=1 Tax=Aureimonas fodinaquatilis TaxID=2565783 RepID=A0A5B0E2A9_9HYPH|nr:alpha/beta hydrolase [Aureimonas fodinaquatilis]KAA0972255.1 alpha/beta hydrolase [Aureimonas fodinaquatilis]